MAGENGPKILLSIGVIGGGAPMLEEIGPKEDGLPKRLRAPLGFISIEWTGNRATMNVGLRTSIKKEATIKFNGTEPGDRTEVIGDKEYFSKAVEHGQTVHLARVEVQVRHPGLTYSLVEADIGFRM